MILLIFAHKKEAEYFFKNLNFRPYSFFFPEVYKTVDNSKLLLITGEGIQNATERTSSLMTHYFQEITDVVNMGIAGALDPSLKLHRIYPVQTCLTEQVGNILPHPKKITTFSSNTSLSCISAHRKILKQKEAEQLSRHAHLVDMESWGIGSVCRLFDVSFHCFKFVSDFPGSNSDNSQQLDRKVKDKRGKIKGMDFGRNFFDFFLQLEL